VNRRVENGTLRRVKKKEIRRKRETEKKGVEQKYVTDKNVFHCGTSYPCKKEKSPSLLFAMFCSVIPLRKKIALKRKRQIVVYVVG